MASGTKVLVSFCAMVIGVLVLYYGVIMPANEPVNPVGADGTMPQKMAAANPKTETPIGSEAAGKDGQPVLIEPASSRTDGPLFNPLPHDSLINTGGEPSAPPSDKDGATTENLSRGPLDIVPVGSLDEATEITTDDPTSTGREESTAAKDQPKDPPDAGSVRPLDESGQPRKTPPQTPNGTEPPAPSRTPTPPTSQPAGAAMTEYTVKSGDTGVSIAKDWFGDGNKWVLISKSNPWIDFNRLQIGQKIKLPPKNAVVAPIRQEVAPDSRTYVVRPGDTLIKIARELYNEAGKWEEIYAANRKTIGDDPAGLRAGMKLTLPSLKPTKPSAG